MRGERTEQTTTRASQSGSSPHARGTRSSGVGSRLRRRFIPACAGNAGPTIARAINHAVHPRMRGERVDCRLPKYASPGSSPHARGTPTRARSFGATKRFIPACAGNANHTIFFVITHPVHPRMRGERDAEAALMVRSVGSSPHARGTRHREHDLRQERRFIPACAGNAGSAFLIASFKAVHPRMRGERIIVQQVL